jgi:hypothetical protein
MLATLGWVHQSFGCFGGGLYFPTAPGCVSSSDKRRRRDGVVVVARQRPPSSPRACRRRRRWNSAVVFG